jgi:hypothetical protein
MLKEAATEGGGAWCIVLPPCVMMGADRTVGPGQYSMPLDCMLSDTGVRTSIPWWE